jgi:hypothetical protein
MEIYESKKYLAARPNKTTLFLRSFLPWQIIRFIFINIRMTVMIAKSHGRRVETEKKEN